MSAPLNFWSGKNYMKRDSSTGSTSIAAPTTAYEGYYRTTYTITHNLGYVPLFRLYYEPFKDGVIYPAQGSRLQGSISKIDGTSSTGPILFGNPTSSVINIELGYGISPLTGTYKIYWVIYKDYSLS